MARYGYTLFSEINGPKALVEQAVQAERAGFDFLVISDHFHPWLDSHGHSPFAWSVLGAVADRTERLDLMTLVTCPTVRYHPAIVAQAAATVAVMSDGRFTLGVGAGERLNEHVVGHGWFPVDVRHEMLEEAVEAIRELWTGDWVTYRGQYVTVEDAKLFTRPETPPEILVAASGTASLRLAAELGDGMVAITPEAALVEEFHSVGGAGKRTHGQAALSYDRDEAKAREYAMRFAFGVPGWKVMAELPNIVNFEAATQTVREDDVVGKLVPAGSDAQAHADALRKFTDAGFEEVCVVQVGEDKDGFFEFWANEVRPRLTG
jgi:G6PDH family F420-dependent oxidoreductase